MEMRAIFARRHVTLKFLLLVLPAVSALYALRPKIQNNLKCKQTAS